MNTTNEKAHARALRETRQSNTARTLSDDDWFGVELLVSIARVELGVEALSSVTDAQLDSFVDPLLQSERPAIAATQKAAFRLYFECRDLIGAPTSWPWK